MPPADYVQRSLDGAWRMMTGRPDGLRQLDLSADGFWLSFWAIVIALPVLVASWVPVANRVAGEAGFAGRLFYVARLAMVDIGVWVLPLAGLAAVCGYIGIRDRFVHYVVSANWGSAILVWILLPPTLIELFFPESGELASLVSICLFIVTLVLSWRLTNVAIGKGPAIATGVFVGMLIASLGVLFVLQDLLGLVV